jgi:mRNA interferase RelE/StbE
MKIKYTKTFSKDLDRIQHQAGVKNRLLSLIETIKEIENVNELGGIKKIQGYSGYYRIRLGDYRAGIKLSENCIEMIRFLHRKDVYRKFP